MSAVPVDVSDHEPVGTDPQGHQRCGACGYRWPCPEVRSQPRQLDADERALLEVLEVGIGYSVWRRLPEGSEDAIPPGGTVVGFEEDDEVGRTLTVLDFPHGRPRWHRFRVDEIEPATVALPNSAIVRGHARKLAELVGRKKGVVDSDEIDHLETALTLMRSIG